MRVKDLIEALKECDQDKPVFIWDDFHDIMQIELVDELSDRVDLNILIKEEVK